MNRRRGLIHSVVVVEGRDAALVQVEYGITEGRGGGPNKESTDDVREAESARKDESDGSRAQQYQAPDSQACRDALVGAMSGREVGRQRKMNEVAMTRGVTRFEREQGWGGRKETARNVAGIKKEEREGGGGTTQTILGGLPNG